MGFDYGYAWEKLYLARHSMMGFSSWEDRFVSGVATFKLALPPRFDLDDIEDTEIRDAFKEVMALINLDGLKDPSGVGLHRVKAESMDDVERNEFSQAIDKLATLLDQRRYLKDLLEDTERGVKTGLSDFLA